ncbi:MAG: magnesium chelatase, partial [Chitinophagales bacterium]
RTMFAELFPDPESFKKSKKPNPYRRIIDWFGKGHEIDMMNELPNQTYAQRLYSIPGLIEVVKQYHKDSSKDEKVFLMEFLLHGLAEYSQLSKSLVQSGFQFKDLFNSMFNMSNFEDSDEDDDNY